jgi:hypothetical protein
MRTATSVPSLLQPETHLLASPAKWTVIVLSVLGVIVALACPSPAKPATKTSNPVIFDVAGEFHGGYALSGTITIDTKSGAFVSASLVIFGGGVGSNDLAESDDLSTIKSFGANAVLVEDAATGNQIELVLPVKNLKGYTGGPLSTLTFFEYPNGGFLPDGTPLYDEFSLISGSLTPP